MVVSLTPDKKKPVQTPPSRKEDRSNPALEDHVEDRDDSLPGTPKSYSDWGSRAREQPSIPPPDQTLSSMDYK